MEAEEVKNNTSQQISIDWTPPEIKLVVDNSVKTEYRKMKAVWSIDQQSKEPIEFERSFRWICESEYLSPHYFSSFDVDYAKKTIKFSYMPIVDDETIWTWTISKYVRDSFTFSTLNGVAEKIKTHTFSRFSIISHRQSFDFADENIAMHTIELIYREF